MQKAFLILSIQLSGLQICSTYEYSQSFLYGCQGANPLYYPIQKIIVQLWMKKNLFFLKALSKYILIVPTVIWTADVADFLDRAGGLSLNLVQLQWIS